MAFQQDNIAQIFLFAHISSISWDFYVGSHWSRYLKLQYSCYLDRLERGVQTLWLEDMIAIFYTLQ